jgi:hypothetical protein
MRRGSRKGRWEEDKETHAKSAKNAKRMLFALYAFLA